MVPLRECLRQYNIRRALSKYFGNLGYAVGKRPWPFALGTLIIYSLLSFGLLRQIFTVKTFDIIVPFDSNVLHQRDRIEELFGPDNCQNFDMGRSTRLERFARIIIEANDGRTVLRSHIFNEIVDLDGKIKNVTFKFNDTTLRYGDVCAKTNGKCFTNDILKYANKMADIESGLYKLKYPIMYDERTLGITFMAMFLGGVTRMENSIVQDAKAISLIYILNFDDPNMDKRNENWEFAFLDLMEKLSYENLTIYYITSDSFAYEGIKSILKVLPPFSVATIFILFFSIVTNVTRDCVTSKPWFAIFGIVVAVVGNGAAFGFCQLLGIPCFSFNITVALLVIGIAMDDMFVLLAAWRLTNPRDDVPTRMRRTYEHAGLAITITSLTNGLAFLIGANTRSMMTYMFCSYAMAAIITCYLATLTFLGPILALSGRLEARGLSGYDFRTPAIPWKLAEKQSFLIRFLYSRGPQDSQSDSEQKITAPSRFFKTTFSNGVLSKFGTFLIILIYILYLASSIYGFFFFRVDLVEKELGEDDSYMAEFLDKSYDLFAEYPQRLQFIIDQELDYSNSSVQKQINTIFYHFENTPGFADSSINEFWLHRFLQFTNSIKFLLSYRGIDLNNEDDFIFCLKNIFLELPVYNRFRQDIIFNENGTKIIASRFLVSFNYLGSAREAFDIVQKIEPYLEKQPIKVFSYNQYYPILDHILLLEEMTVHSIIIATIVMMAISLIMVHNLLYIFLTTFSIVSVEIGVVGFMGLLDISLSAITMVMLIVSIGFSIDITTHIVCAFRDSKTSEADGRIRDALSYVGYPIFQGYVTSMMSSWALCVASSALKLKLFKIFNLVLFFSLLHGLLVLPCLISLLFCIGNKWKVYCKDSTTKYPLEKNNHCNSPLMNS